MVVLAEDTTIPARLGRHPFAAGAGLPPSVNAVLLYDRATPVPQRLGLGRVPAVVLPLDFASTGVAGAAEDTLSSGTTLQSCADYRCAAWSRSETPGRSIEADEALAGRAAVLLPWNLGAPGSLVPDVLRKVALLAAQDRFPLTVVVLPYNDVPGSLALLEEVATSCAEPQVASPAILLARAGSIRESLALLRLCRRAWIDTADPEWRWTLRRIAACGLGINFISGVPQDAVVGYEPGPFEPDELMTRQSNGRAGLLFWRTRVLSLRRLSGLADAVEQGRDVPFRPSSSEWSGRSDRPTLQELLQRVQFGGK
jgi:hypothetical protein